eukprot:TRINITY_DN26389_c0_g1_i1.p1 TRINITY_DN26389_c0_g1~~TRINITY_DN26389_c0_g1_i1.p1  ORF type:complete len:152 (-),score=34.00 TRINITY_DN26389_c0_g1_i1:1300-1755(-)
MYIVLRPESGEKNEEEKQSSDSGKEGKMKKSAQKEEKAKEEQDAGEEKPGEKAATEGGQGSEVRFHCLINLPSFDCIPVTKVNFFETLHFEEFFVFGKRKLFSFSARIFSFMPHVGASQKIEISACKVSVESQLVFRVLSLPFSLRQLLQI